MLSIIQFFDTEPGRQLLSLLIGIGNILLGLVMGKLRTRFQALLNGALDAASGKPAEEIAATNFINLERAKEFETAVKRSYVAAQEDGVAITDDYAKTLAKNLAFNALFKKAQKKLKL